MGTVPQTQQQPTNYTLAHFNSTLTNPKTQDYLESILKDKKGSFVNNITSLVASNSKLANCEPLGLLYAGIKATALDLPLDANLGLCFVIPFKDNKTGITNATFQISAKGLKTLAKRSGQYKYMNDGDVREGELKKRDRLTGIIDFDFIEDDVLRMQTPIIGYFSYFKLLNGYESMLYMSVAEIKDHAGIYSQTYKNDLKYNGNSSKWSSEQDFPAMAKKTVTKLNLSRNGILSVEMQTAIQADQSVITENGYRYIDNEKETDIEKAKKVNDIFANAFEDANVVPETEPTTKTEMTDSNEQKTEGQTAEDNFMKSPKMPLK